LAHPSGPFAARVEWDNLRPPASAYSEGGRGWPVRVGIMAAMDTRTTLLAAILDRPGDDTPRLAFADWLDDHAADLPHPDDARAWAEFVRVHVEYAAQLTADRLAAERGGYDPFGRFSERAHQLRDRWTELLRTPRDWFDAGDWARTERGDPTGRGSGVVTWTPPELGPDEPGFWAWPVRGFVGQVACHPDLWCAHAAAILAAHPVRVVALTSHPRHGFGPFAGGTSDDAVGYEFPRWPGLLFTTPLPGEDDPQL
jgi:uncharacterized protein (TIGR02996 family)